MKITILQSQIKALIGKHYSRPAMQFVYFNKSKNEFCITNGHALVVLRATNELDSLEGMPETCLIPLDAFAVKLPKNLYDYDLEVEVSENETSYTTTILNSVSKEYRFKEELDLTFPNYGNVMLEYNEDTTVFEFGLSIKVLSQFSGLFKGAGIEHLKFSFVSNKKAIKIQSVIGEHNELIGLKTAIVMPVIINNKY
jgi:hypothetical protein